ncbi:Crp/Fnr family transcriptional regulator [Rhodovarius crocodyli]|uniref:Crp/Fnr family transcriptional regulator n=1 Tax=Rhodovarius crocodyli TaxID=1979269 RepID=A0A437MJR1_9PROT|nr:Crp/Fnr family transcriptional regulator [Rhodovarius crocodyli]RVT97882.1 Crp/Fnr family transcriptional regulator [Rhodovarius crocodyli]
MLNHSLIVRTAPQEVPAACANCGGRTAGICAALDTAGLEEISHETRRTAVRPHDMLYHEGDSAQSVVMLMRGVAKLTRQLPNGRQQVVGFRFAGDILGFTTRRSFASDAEMLTEGQVCRISRLDFEGMLARFPATQRRLIDLCSQELAEAQEQLVTVGRRQAEQRVAAFLIALAEAARRRGQSYDVLDMPMTRAEIGDLLGLALETVSRAFTQLKKRGFVKELGRGRVELPDIPALAAMAEGDIE